MEFNREWLSLCNGWPHLPELKMSGPSKEEFVCVHQKWWVARCNILLFQLPNMHKLEFAVPLSWLLLSTSSGFQSSPAEISNSCFVVLNCIIKMQIKASCWSVIQFRFKLHMQIKIQVVYMYFCVCDHCWFAQPTEILLRTTGVLVVFSKSSGSWVFFPSSAQGK